MSIARSVRSRILLMSGANHACRSDRMSKLLVSALAWLTLMTSAQPSAYAQEKPLEIGVLALGPRKLPAWRCGPGYELASQESKNETMPQYVVGLKDQLENLKYVEARKENAGRPGRRFVLDVKMGSLPDLKRYAREFANRPVDIIVGIATAAVQVAKEETKDRGIPILMTGVSDPTKATGDGFVDSLARPGGLITGVSHQQVQGSGKRVELLKEMLPQLQRLITLRRPGYVPSEKSLAETRLAAERLKIEILDWTATSRESLQTILKQVRRELADAMILLPDSLIFSNLDLVIETSLERNVPLMALQDYMALQGALAAYGPSAYQAGGLVATYVDKIVKGTPPGEIPVYPADPTFVVNLKAAECHGISLPIEILRQANRVIQ
jgi:putative tryptophan/tyrosine transport system substrate-binding protein